jgi:hypothetical protein
MKKYYNKINNNALTGGYLLPMPIFLVNKIHFNLRGVIGFFKALLLYVLARACGSVPVVEFSFTWCLRWHEISAFAEMTRRGMMIAQAKNHNNQ